ADGVAARLAGRDPGLGEPVERLLDVGRGHEVELHVLARRDVALAAGEPLGDVGERLELRGRDDAAGELGADHHQAVLALAVDAVQEAERAPVVGGQLAALERLEALDEQVDVGAAGEPEPAGRDVRDIDDAHEDLSRESGARARPSWSASAATAPITRTAGSSPAGGAAGSWCSWPRHVEPPACDAPWTIAAGVDGGQPRAIRRAAIAARSRRPISTTRVSAPGARPSRIGPYAASAWPEITANPEASPRCVTGIPASAGAATADETPGTTS